jgi:hypothetical protein
MKIYIHRGFFVGRIGRMKVRKSTVGTFVILPLYCAYHSKNKALNRLITDPGPQQVQADFRYSFLWIFGKKQAKIKKGILI